MTGGLHLALGTFTYQQPLLAMARAGVLNSLEAQPERDGALWYFVAGGFLITAGATVRWSLRRAGRAPAPLGWGLAVIALVGVVVAPLSGFWLVLVEGVLLVVLGRGLDRVQPSVGVSRAELG